MDYSQTRAVSPDDRLMAAIRIIVRQELATVLTNLACPAPMLPVCREFWGQPWAACCGLPVV